MSLRNFRLAFWLAATSWDVAAAHNPMIGQLSDAAGKTWQTVQVPRPAGKSVQAIVYGNRHYGFFETKEFSEQGSSISFGLIPPGYQYPIHTWLRTDRLERSRILRFASPFPSVWRRNFAVRSRGPGFSRPFLLLTASVSKEKESSSRTTAYSDKRVFPLIMNRNGEPVWLHFPAHELDQPEVQLIVKPAGDGTYRLLRVTQFPSSAYEKVDVQGRELEKRWFGGDTLHHDFHVTPSGKMLAPAHVLRFYRRPWRPFTSYSPFLVSVLKELDLASGVQRFVWDGLSGNPYEEPGWTKTTGFHSALSPHSRNLPNWWDVVHVNSIEEVPNKGYLLSLRNFSRVLLLDYDFKHVHWSIGPGRENTFTTEGTPAYFRMQHHATLQPNGNLMLFDNLGTDDSRVLELALDHVTKTVAVARLFRPEPPQKIKLRGSAYAQPNGNVVAFFPAVKDEATATNSVIEFDGTTQRQFHQLTYFRGMASGTSAEPMASIGREKFLGFAPPAGEEQNSRPRQ